MKWMKLYQKIGSQQIRITQTNDVFILLDDDTSKTDKDTQIDLKKERNKIPLDLKFDKHGVPYFVLKNQETK